MRLLFVNHHRRFKSGIRAGAIAKRLAARGHEVVLMVVANRERLRFREYELDDIRYIESPDLFWGRARSGWDPVCAFRRYRRLTALGGGFDVVHLFGTRPASILPGLAYVRKYATPLVLDWEDWWGRGGLIRVNRPGWYQHTLGYIEVFFEEYFRPYGDGHTVVSTALAHRAEGLGVHPDTVLVLRAVPDAALYPDLTSEQAKSMLRLPAAHRYIGFASLDLFLDIDLPLRALARVVQSDASIHLLITGHAPKKLKRLLTDLDLLSRTTMTGFLDDAQYGAALSACDLLLLPFPDNVNNRGRWPSKVASYMAVGRAILTNRTGSMKELQAIEPFLHFCEHTVDDYYRAITSLLDDRDSLVRSGELGKQVFERELSFDVQIPRLEEFYERCIDRSRPRLGRARTRY